MKRSHGFTLVELLIVIVVVAILAAVAIPKFAENSFYATEPRLNWVYALNAKQSQDFTQTQGAFPPHREPPGPTLRPLHVLTKTEQVSRCLSVASGVPTYSLTTIPQDIRISEA